MFLSACIISGLGKLYRMFCGRLKTFLLSVLPIFANCNRHLGSLSKLHRLTQRDSRLAHYFVLFWIWGYFWAIQLLPVQYLM